MMMERSHTETLKTLILLKLYS